VSTKGDFTVFCSSYFGSREKEQITYAIDTLSNFNVYTPSKRLLLLVS
jgi:hypothetical protein